MLGGPSRSGTALDHANELLEAAARLKKRMKRPDEVRREERTLNSNMVQGPTQTEYTKGVDMGHEKKTSVSSGAF